MQRICLFFVALILNIVFLSYCNVDVQNSAKANIVKTSSLTISTGKTDKVTELSEVEKAFQEVAYCYYMRGKNIQYNPMKRALFSPEEATSQNINYLVCSGFTQNVYKEFLDLDIPPYTYGLLRYGKENIGTPEVVAYGYKRQDQSLVMSFYDSNTEKHLNTFINPTLEDILPYLRCGDVLTFTGHTILIYDLVYDDGKVVDAHIIQSVHGNNNYYVQSKLSKKISVGKDIKFGSGNRLLFHNSRTKTSYGNIVSEGSLSIGLLSNVKSWKNIGLNNRKKEYSILRFIQKDNLGRSVLNYKGKKYGGKDFNNTIIQLSTKVKDRLKYNKLYIEKNVDIHANSIVEAKDLLTYTIVIKNNSGKDYFENIEVKEIISDYVTFKNSKVNKDDIIFNINQDNKIINWNIGKLKKDEEVNISYTVMVKENCEGKIIESNGWVMNIPSGLIRNTIGLNLNKNQQVNIIREYARLKHLYSGKKLIDEIYKQALGINLDFEEFNISNLIEDSNKESTNGTTITINKRNRFSDCVLNKYWNTISVKTCNYKQNEVIEDYCLKYWRKYDSLDRRSDTIYRENFKTGDILVYINRNDNQYAYKNNKIYKKPVTYENGEYVYIFIEGEGFVGVNYGDDGFPGTLDDRNSFNTKYYRDNGLELYTNLYEKNEQFLEFANYQTLFGKDYYVILRPSLAFALK